MNKQSDYQYLKESPMFHFSLHAKELFHSNFLAWLGMDPELRDIFKNVLVAGFGIDEEKVNSWGNEIVVLREKDDLDLIVKAPDSWRDAKRDKANKQIVPGTWYVVIENKVKSIPTKEQLERYAERCGKDTEKLLLVIAGSPQELNDGWRRVNYTQIVNALKATFNNVIDSYKKAIISDYIGMVEALVNIVETQDVDMTSKFLYHPSKDLYDLRIDDLVDKWRAAHIARIFSTKTGLNYDSGYTNNQSLIETFVRFNDLSVWIQIQGSQYRHCIVGNIKESEVADKSKGFLSKTRKNFRDEMLKRYPGVFKNDPVRGEDNRDFNSYNKNKEGETFWYQYVTINPDATILQIMDCVVEDMKIAKIFFPFLK